MGLCGHELDAVPPADLGHLYEVVGYLADLFADVVEELRSMRRRCENEDPSWNLRRAFEAVDRATRKIVEITLARRDCFAVDREVHLSIEYVIGLVPIVPMRGRAHSPRDIFFK